MYYTDDSLYPENMQPLIITAAPYGPSWLPGDATDIAVTWDEQVQAAVDCYNAGATVLHLHVRNPATGHLSADIEHFNYLLERLKKAVPKLIIQVGGSIAFDHPKDDGDKVKWLSYDTRHMLAELTPTPETVTVAIGTCMMDITQMWTPDDIKGTHLERDPKAMAAWAGMYTDAGPAFYLEHLKRLRKAGIQPYFTLAHVHQLEIVERLIRHGVYMGPLNTNITTYGGGGCGHNPFDWMHWLQREPQGAIVTFWGGDAGQCGRPASGDHPGPARAGRHRGQSLEQQARAHDDGAADRGDRATLRAFRPQGRDSGGSARDHENRGLVQQRGGDAEEPRYAAQPRGRRPRLHGLGDRRKEERRSMRCPIRIPWPTAWCHQR